MILSLLLVLVQNDPRIEKIERLAIDIPRPLSCAPLAVSVRSDKGWSGPIVVKSRFGFSVVRDIVVPAGGLVREIVPALDPLSVEVGGSTSPLPKAEPRAELAVAVDVRLPYELESSAQVRYVRVAPDDLRRLLAGGMLEGVDLVLVQDLAGLDAGGAPALRVAPTKEAALQAVAAPRLSAVDASVWRLAPEGGWVPTKRARAQLLAAGYALAGFAILAWRGGRRTVLAVAAISLLGLLGFAVFFPRGQVWIEEIAVETGASERRIWFVGAATSAETTLVLPRLALPLFQESSGAERPFTIRVSERGCRIEGLSLGPRRSACFASFGSAPAAPGRMLKDAVLRSNQGTRFLGDVPADAAPGAGSATAPPADPRRAPFERFLEGKLLFGWLDGAAGPVKDVDAEGLADARRAGRFYARTLE